MPVRHEIRFSFAAQCQESRKFLFLAVMLALITPLQSASAQAPPAPPAPQPRFAVVLDAAHGGDDSGGRLASGQPEKAYTLAMSVRLRSQLGVRGVQVITTREQDTGIDLTHRAEIANHANAQACLSLHASESGSGVHLFVSSLYPMQPSRFTPWKTAQAAWVTRSLALAGVLNSALLHAGVSVTLSRSSLPGVDSMACPAVAVEVAPDRDASLKTTADLDNAGYQSRIAGALAAAILEWQTEAHAQ